MPRRWLIAAAVGVLAAIVIVALVLRNADDGSSSASVFDRPVHRAAGGATRPAPARAPARPAATTDITELTGVRLSADDRRSFRLVGNRNSRYAPLSPGRLADYFAVCLRAFHKHSRPPALSIEPTRQQLRQGVYMRGPQTVKYLFGCENTTLGLMAFAADRRMKCLSHGKDNLTGAPVTSSVAGYSNMLDRMLASPTQNQVNTRHRLWIEPQAAKASISGDRSYICLDVTMHVEAKQQEVVNGELVDVEGPIDPITKAFADHLSVHYSDFAALDPTFAEVKAGAQMSLLAYAAWSRATNQDPADDLPIDVDWWRKSYPLQPVRTPPTTPAGRAEKVKKSETRRPIPRGEEIITNKRTVRVAGGVDFWPPTPPSVTTVTSLSPPAPGGPAAGNQQLESRKRRRHPRRVLLTGRQAGSELRFTIEGSDLAAVLPARLLDMPAQDSTLREVRTQLDPLLSALPPADGSPVDVVVCLPDSPSAGQRQNLLRRAYPAVRFGGRNGEVARKNHDALESMTATPRRPSLLMVRKSLNRDHWLALDSYENATPAFLNEQRPRSAAEIPADADLLIAVGHLSRGDAGQSAEHIAELRRAFMGEKLKGTFLIDLSCGGPSLQAFIKEMFRDPARRPVGVFAPLGPIDAGVVRRLLESISRIIGAARTTRPDDLIRDALQQTPGADEIEKQGVIWISRRPRAQAGGGSALPPVVEEIALPRKAA